jgi:hypothetical protein
MGNDRRQKKRAMSDGPAGAGWRSDPWRTYELRYFDGVKFTDQVASGGKVATDPFFDLDAPLPPTTPAAASVASTEPVAPAPARDSRLPWVILAVIVLALVVAGGIFAATRDDSDDAPAVSTTTIEKTTTTTEARTTTSAQRPTTTEASPTTEAPPTSSTGP